MVFESGCFESCIFPLTNIYLSGSYCQQREREIDHQTPRAAKYSEVTPLLMPSDLIEVVCFYTLNERYPNPLGGQNTEVWMFWDVLPWYHDS